MRLFKMIEQLNNRGFTLIELMTVVSFIGILSAIAIPNYLRIRLVAKTAEAKANLGAIRTCEEAYKIEDEVYMACNPCPDSIPNGKLTKVAFTGAGKNDFDIIGFEPIGDVWYQYSVTSTDLLTIFLAIAEGDLDGDGNHGEYRVDNVSKTIVNMANTFF